MENRPRPDPPFYAARFDSIRKSALPSMAKVEAGDFTWRDIFILLEHLQQFMDVLEEMIETPPAYDYYNPDEMAEWVAKELTNHGR